MSELDPESCKDVPEKGKAKALIAAYAKAAENNDLEHYKDMLREHSRAMEEEAEKQEAAEAAKSAKKPKAEKKKRKSDAKAKVDDDEDIDMEDADGSEDVKKSSKKRKKALDSDDEGTEKVCFSQLSQEISLTLLTSLRRLQRPPSSS